MASHLVLINGIDSFISVCFVSLSEASESSFLSDWYHTYIPTSFPSQTAMKRNQQKERSKMRERYILNIIFLTKIGFWNPNNNLSDLIWFVQIPVKAVVNIWPQSPKIMFNLKKKYIRQFTLMNESLPIFVCFFT